MAGKNYLAVSEASIDKLTNHKLNDQWTDKNDY